MNRAVNDQIARAQLWVDTAIKLEDDVQFYSGNEAAGKREVERAWANAGRLLPDILAALTQPTDPNDGREAQPVAWMYTRYDGYWIVERERDHKRLPPWTDEGVWTETPLYASPPPEAQPGAVREALQEAIDVFEGMCDDEIEEELLPRLRKALAATPAPAEPTEAEAREVLDSLYGGHAILSKDEAIRAMLAFATTRPAAAVERSHPSVSYQLTHPRLPKDCDLFAVNCNTGEWYYRNHANTWQGMPNPLEARSSAEFHQRRGMLADTVSWAVNEYDEWMRDDHYDARAPLDRIVKRLRETLAAIHQGE